MKVGIVGAGFTGLAAANRLSKSGQDVTVFEKDSKPGGLAVGFKDPNWEWTIEKHYHHWFTSDWHIRNLAKEIDIKLIFKRAKTSTLYKGEIYQLDSPLNLLKFPHLSLIERIRTGIVIAYLRYLGSWKSLEGIKSEKFLKATMGNNSWKILWEPLYKSKFRMYAKDVPMSWFWARMKKRSPSLGYPKGGFQAYVERLVEFLTDSGNVKFLFEKDIEKIERLEDKIVITSGNRKYYFDKVICTAPFALLAKLVPQLPKSYVKKIKSFKGIGAVNLLLSLKKQFFDDGTYWLSVNDDMPFLAVVEHTNFIDPKHYGEERLLYVGNYLENSHPYFKFSKEELLKEFMPHLQKINPKFNRSWVIKSYLFPAFFAQPITPLNYSKVMPPLATPVKGIYSANMQQIHPWDRGTTFAVELGGKVADLVIKSE